MLIVCALSHVGMNIILTHVDDHWVNRRYLFHMSFFFPLVLLLSSERLLDFPRENEGKLGWRLVDMNEQMQITSVRKRDPPALSTFTNSFTHA